MGGNAHNIGSVSYWGIPVVIVRENLRLRENYPQSERVIHRKQGLIHISMRVRNKAGP